MGWFSRAKKKVTDFGKRSRKKLSKFDDHAKRIGRKGISLAAKAQPYVTAPVAGGLTFIPGIGPVLAGVYTGIESAVAPYIGATAARHEGLSGRDARAVGRDQRQTVAIAGGIATVAGTIINQVLPALFGGGQAAAPAAGAKTGAALTSQQLGAAQAANSAGLLFSPVPGVAPVAATSLIQGATTAAGLNVAGGGVLGLLGDAGKFLLDTGGKLAPQALSAYLTPHTTVPTGKGDLEGDVFEISSSGGAGGQATPAEESVSDTFTDRGMSLGGKLLFAGGAVAALYFGSKLLKRKAA